MDLPEIPARGKDEDMPVLLVEDDPVVREIIECVLAASGLEVTGASTGDEALALLRQGYRFELLLTDLQLPGDHDGWSIAVEARRFSQRIPVIYLTATHQQSNPVNGSVFLRKPVSPKLLLEVVGALLGRPLRTSELTAPQQVRIGPASYIH
jgi:DNA-binding response OmpR family regulator